MSREGVELIGRMADGDHAAFGAFYDLHAPLAFGLIRRILPEAADAEEVLQEVFWELWQGATQYDAARGSPAAWVVTRARSRAIDRLRAQRKREARTVEHVDTVQHQPPERREEDLAARISDREVVQGALSQLVPAQREVIELAYFRGLSHSEIASRLSQPLGTVKTRIRSGLQSLRALLHEPALGTRA